MRERREKLYERVPVTDALAAERTFLASERTLLAYMRTSLAMLVAGVSGAHFLDEELLVTVGYLLAITSVLVFALGLLRYRRSERATRRVLRTTERVTSPPPPPSPASK